MLRLLPSEVKPVKVVTSRELRWSDWFEPYPRVTPGSLDRYRADLTAFAKAYTPAIVRRHSDWKIERHTTWDVLRQMPGILAWMRTPMLVGIPCRTVLTLSVRDRRPKVAVARDDAFEIVVAFARLAGKFVGKLRTCPACPTEFVAVGRKRFCSVTCAAKVRMRRHRESRSRHISRRSD